MFSNIRTSRANKELVTQLTNKLNLGAENTIARLAFSYSLAKEQYLDLTKIEDSAGKEYSTKVLFGNYTDIYVALICVHYNIQKEDKDVGRYIKMHIDDGLKLIEKDVDAKNHITGNDFLINEIEKGLDLAK
ncbi:DndE family protein [Pedobacter sp. MR2016-19]|uniref:DndE family protein n=1 Tax=Pedobacter sp. MR2016-19 TaxID=2780089 RepID=UPI0018758215|nr:DndE family protein [Pedobacter sp. MR2016-19]MBE5320041.1 DndE family protein [Pedobacter sp. MR2016-19]